MRRSSYAREKARSRRSQWRPPDTRLIESPAQEDGRQLTRTDARHLRPPGAVRDHAARGGAWLCRAPFRRHDGVRAGPHQPESHPPYRPDRHDRSADTDPFADEKPDWRRAVLRLGEAGAGELLGAAQAP